MVKTETVAFLRPQAPYHEGSGVLGRMFASLEETFNDAAESEKDSVDCPPRYSTTVPESPDAVRVADAC